jgi:putative ABC transport system substrate-binding protein
MRSAALLAAAAPLSALAHHGQPHIPRIYVILYRGETPVEQGFREYLAERKLEAELIVRNVELDASRVPALLAEARALGVDLIYIGPDSFLAFHRHLLTQAALDARLPTYAATEVNVRRSRAMFGLVSGYHQLGRLTAHKATQILYHGVRPDAIPIETLGSFSYLVNTDVAAQLGIPLPKSVLQRAELIR